MGRDVNLFLYSSWAIILLSHDLFEYFAVTGCQEGLGNNVKLRQCYSLARMSSAIRMSRRMTTPTRVRAKFRRQANPEDTVIWKRLAYKRDSELQHIKCFTERTFA